MRYQKVDKSRNSITGADRSDTNDNFKAKLVLLEILFSNTKQE